MSVVILKRKAFWKHISILILMDLECQFIYMVNFKKFFPHFNPYFNGFRMSVLIDYVNCNVFGKFQSLF